MHTGIKRQRKKRRRKKKWCATNTTFRDSSLKKKICAIGMHQRRSWCTVREKGAKTRKKNIVKHNFTLKDENEMDVRGCGSTFLSRAKWAHTHTHPRGYEWTYKVPLVLPFLRERIDVQYSLQCVSMCPCPTEVTIIRNQWHLAFYSLHYLWFNERIRWDVFRLISNKMDGWLQLLTIIILVLLVHPIPFSLYSFFLFFFFLVITIIKLDMHLDFIFPRKIGFILPFLCNLYAPSSLSGTDTRSVCW